MRVDGEQHLLAGALKMGEDEVLPSQYEEKGKD